ncbi:MAG: glycine cleavage system protein GcvH [Rhodospirillaceae bacterium]|nr:glycine cleavage system protein GcvH [Rhodospirillaceae bacterium]MBT6608346.1 glycine cleavage system protein GcvH [Rhodospirillaceae bacterium]
MMTTKYSEDHEWIIVDGDIGTVGITDHAQSQLGDIVFVELPEVGSAVEAGTDAGVVESVKAASDLMTPVSGEITETNDALEAEPSLANSAPTGDGWFFKVKLSDTSELDGLMDEAAYKAFCAD